MLAEDGIVIFTMMASKHYYYRFRTGEINDGLCTVDVPGKWSTPTAINFVTSEDDMLLKFSMFEKVFTGHYDMSYYDFNIPVDATLHYYFVGKNRE